MSLERLHTAHRLTEEMLRLAGAGEWEGVPALEDERRACLSELDWAATGEQERDTALDLLRRIQTMNRELLALSEAERARVRENLLNLKRGDKARQAYR